MDDWTYYRIDLDLLGEMTQLPDSQKIFGALMHRFSSVYDAEQTTKMVKQIQEGTMPFALSNMLPKDYFPIPHTELLDLMEVDGRSNKEEYKALKKRVYVKIEQLTALMEGRQSADQLYPYVYTESTQQIHASLDSKRYHLPGLDPTLYSVPGIVVKQVDSPNQSGIVRKFTFYLGLSDIALGEFNGTYILDLLKRERDRSGSFILGPRGSQGMNTFVVTEVEPERTINSKQAGFFLNLGMMLPKRIDFAQSSLKLFTSERRPYKPLEGWEESEHQGRFISFIEAGSIVHAPEGIAGATQSVESPFFSRDTVFGNALLYPLNMKEEA
ncbi:hypothetical protein NKT34_29435 [Paenibacillus polysaccharolyticus]|uniref:hypothetical protein n=1 Tax=Paenibacillus polysaccharolyticus TaxID=582692 RepID=UPI00209E93E2|nr:hypothetical protein [Paenibacillus polysaccharolyticus]MCP1137382.1 hypothetical protein [Paenibacillus polysaccharolyticus]